MNKKWFQYGAAYGLWVVFTLVGVYFIILSRTSLLGLLNRYYVPSKVLGTFQRGMEVNFIDKAYLLVAAFAVLILMIVVEEYFKYGVRKGVLLKRILKVFGFEIFFMFLASLASAILVGFSPLIWGLLILLLVASTVMIYFGAKLPDTSKLRHRMDKGIE